MNNQDLSAEIERRLVARVAEELSPVDVAQRVRDMLDERYSFDAVGGPFEHMQPSRVLEKMEPTAFRCAVADESASDTLEEIGGESYEREEVDALRETIRDEIEAEQDAEV